MFDAHDFTFDLKPLSPEPQLVIIPINKLYGVIAVVKPLGNGKAACIAFSPATKLDNPFQNYRPTFLRKMITTDFQLRAGRWPELSVEKPSGMTLRSAVNVLLRDFDHVDIETTQEINLRRPTNTSSSPEVSSVTFSSPENVPFERALGHLVGLEFTIAYDLTKFQASLLTHVAGPSKLAGTENPPTIQSPNAAATTQS